MRLGRWFGVGASWFENYDWRPIGNQNGATNGQKNLSARGWGDDWDGRQIDVVESESSVSSGWWAFDGSCPVHAGLVQIGCTRDKGGECKTVIDELLDWVWYMANF